MSALLRWSIVGGVALSTQSGYAPVPAESWNGAALNAQVTTGLDARNSAFLDAVELFDVDSMLTFFPREGEFTYTFTSRHSSGNTLGFWRFPASDARRAIEGPLRLSLTPEDGMYGIGSFVSALSATHSNWRRVGRSRFVPPEAPSTSPTYVEWRREGSRWVVAAFGDEGLEDGMEPSWSPTAAANGVQGR